VGQKSGKDACEAGACFWGVREASLEKQGVGGEAVDVRGNGFWVSAAAEVVRPEGIDCDEEDVRHIAEAFFCGAAGDIECG